jgi:hypothetical protein
LKVVYLDQNKWIDVAKAFHGKTDDPALKAAFADVRELARQGTVAFPLSWVHYMETAKVTNHQRRALGHGHVGNVRRTHHGLLPTNRPLRAGIRSRPAFP